MSPVLGRLLVVPQYGEGVTAQPAGHRLMVTGWTHHLREHLHIESERLYFVIDLVEDSQALQCHAHG